MKETKARPKKEQVKLAQTHTCTYTAVAESPQWAMNDCKPSTKSYEIMVVKPKQPTNEIYTQYLRCLASLETLPQHVPKNRAASKQQNWPNSSAVQRHRS